MLKSFITLSIAQPLLDTPNAQEKKHSDSFEDLEYKPANQSEERNFSQLLGSTIIDMGKTNSVKVRNGVSTPLQALNFTSDNLEPILASAYTTLQ